MMRCFALVLTVLAVVLGTPQPGQAQGAEAAVRAAATEVLSARHPESASQLDVRVRRVWDDIDTTRALRVQFSDAGGQPTRLARVDLRVRGNVIDNLRSIDVLSRDKRKKMGGVQDALSTLRQMLGEELPDEGVADYIGLSVEAYHELLRDAQRWFSLSLSRPIDDEQTMLDVLPNEDAEAGFERFEKASTQKHLQNLIETLPKRQQTILDLSAARIFQLLGKIQLTLESKFEEHVH